MVACPLNITQASNSKHIYDVVYYSWTANSEGILAQLNQKAS